MLKPILTCLLAFIAGHVSMSQRLNWTTFKLTEENEFFNVTQRGIDRYYTQGMRFEFLYQASKRKFLEKLMVPVSVSSINNYSVSLSQQIYTPAKTDAYFFAGDRPYAGTLYFSEALESSDSAKQFRLTTRLDAGIIGQAALAKQTQLFFHKIIENDLAVGWDTQLRNDIYLNYSLKAERNLISAQRHYRLELSGELNVGTALISAVPGLKLEFGSWYNSSGKFAWQIFFRPEVRFVLYNALLQGGILNQAYADELYSQFFIDKIEPVVYSHSTGFRLRYKNLGLLYRQVNLTKEFKGQRPHYYSTLMFSFPLH
jgi:hypothetical protein